MSASKSSEVLPLSEDVEGGERGRGEGDSSLCDGGGTGKEEEGEAPPLGAEEVSKGFLRFLLETKV